MLPASKSKSKDKKAGKDPQKASSKSSGHANAGSGAVASGYNPLFGTFHTLETVPQSSAPALQVNGRFRNIDETGDHSGTGIEYDSISNNGSWSGESEDHKEKLPNIPLRQEVIPGADNDKREKIRQKNEKKHQRQKEKRAQELRERCSGYIMSRKLEALARQLVAMGFSVERATLALILNEGRVEESVAWLFEGGDEADNHMEHNFDGGNNLKIDISEELAQISEMEVRYKCSKQDVERAIVACEGDIDKAAETLRLQKQDPPPSAPPKPEETGDPSTLSNGKLPVILVQNLSRAPPKPTNLSTPIQQKRDEKDFNYTKTPVTVGPSVESGSKKVQPSRRIEPKLDWAKPQQTATLAEKRWNGAGSSNPSASYSLGSPLQASTPPAKSETRYVAVGNELKNLQIGSVREPVIVMQRPQPLNTKPGPTTSISSSSPPGTAAGWYPNCVEIGKPNALLQHIPSTTRGLGSNNLSSSQMYNQLHYQHQHQHQHQHQQFGSTNGLVDSLSPSRGNGLWKTGTSPTLAAASSLGLFSGLGSNCSSGSSSPVDWNTGGSTQQLDYTNIDWSLDLGLSGSRSIGLWQGVNSTSYESYTSGMSGRTAMRAPSLSNGNGVSVAGLQDGGVAPAETSAGGSREWSSPFEEKDLFSVPRKFVSSPSL